MKCDICGQDFEQDGFEFIKNGEEIYVCEECILTNADLVEDVIAKRGAS